MRNGTTRRAADASLSPGQIDILITIERTGAGLSMVAIFLTVLTFVVFKKLRTTPNLFLVFASIADAGASTASMMGYDGLRMGQNSSLCQAQAFIFEWCSDPWWSFAMAVNVFLVFFYNANPASFRKYLWVYCLVCFGGPMIPAIALISIRGDPRGPVYGDAAVSASIKPRPNRQLTVRQLWCWIGPNWSLVRLYAYYIPIWVCILLSIVIYFAVGYHVFHHRNQLLNMGLHEKDPRKPSRSGSDGGDSAEEARQSRTLSVMGVVRTNTIWQSLTRRYNGYGTVVTEVKVTSGLPDLEHHDLPATPTQAYTTSGIASSSSWAARLHGGGLDLGDGRQKFETICSSDHQHKPRATLLGKLRSVASTASLKLKRLDPVKMAYLRTSFIFAFAVLITWIPSSINRLYSLTNEGRISFQLSVASGCVLPLQGVWNAIIYLTTS
ncbi:Cyclic AMP receptor-like protein A [Tolypocladium paradoxum]|uniref:Cyclic AMP receptor-like protein A n=1 Tax=Tolypocladium paradoxum TaxID=94208 RepID=A0A2S4L0A7_9HYPO|nr:Cyclic AMP receptor-like protein A [Tolypocladium paradoxum]